MLYQFIQFYVGLLCLSLVKGVPTSSNEPKLYAPNPPVTETVLMGVNVLDAHGTVLDSAELKIDLYSSVTRKAAANFLILARGIKIPIDPNDPTKVVPLTYQGKNLDQIFENDKIIGGDIIKNMPYSIFGKAFPDESYVIDHDRPGRISCMNAGEPNTNEGRFMIDINPDGSPERNGKNQVFGQVTHGLDDLIEILKRVPMAAQFPLDHMVEISYCATNELKISDLDEKHQKYLENLEKFKNGDMSVGVPLSIQSYKDLPELLPSASTGEFFMDQEIAGATPLRKLFLVGIVIAAIYYIYLNKEAIKLIGFSKSNKLSLRKE